MARGFTTAGANYLATTSSPSDSNWTGALSVSAHVYIASTTSDRYFLGKHTGNGATSNPFDFRTGNTGSVVLALDRANTGVSIWVGAAVTTGSWRVCGFSAPSDINSAPNFYDNGTKTAGTLAFGNSTGGAATGSSAEIRVGRRADGGSQMDGYIAEIGAWNVELTDAEHAALGKGVSPLLIRPASLFFYLPLVRGTNDVRGGLAFSETNTPTVESHPRVIYPRRRTSHRSGPAAPATGQPIRKRMGGMVGNPFRARGVW